MKGTSDILLLREEMTARDVVLTKITTNIGIAQYFCGALKRWFHVPTNSFTYIGH